MVLILISLGFAPFLREDVYSFYLLVPILIIIILLILFFRDLNRLFSNILLFFISLIPLISYMVIKTFLKLILTNYWNQDFNTIKLINHGSGHSLFLSLGYTDNPFNIAWSDFNGLTQGKILSGNPYFCSFFDSSCLNLLGIKYFELSYNFPFVLLKNIFYKFADFLSFTLNSSFFEQHQFASITNSSRFGKIFILIILLYLFILIIQFYLNNINLNINYLIISSSAVISGMVLPIIIFPTYISIFQGAVIMQIYFISLLLNNSIGVTRLEFVARFNRYLINFFMFSLIFMILAFAYAGLKYRDLKINQNFITTNSLEDSLNRFDYEYAYYFNSLSKNEKNILISKLNINSNLRVKNWSSQFDKSQIYFKSNLAVLIQNRLLVFVFLPEQNFPKISFDQGRFHAGIHICPNCKNVNLDPGFSVMDSPIIFLNDDSWNNEWRVVVFPVDQNIFSKYSNLLVYGLVKNLPKNGTAWGFTFNYTNSTILSTNE
jgi:hypothetical protein